MSRARGSGSWEAEAGELLLGLRSVYMRLCLKKQQIFSDNTEVLLLDE